MKITFLGAARTVTGSCYVIETDHCRFAVDCGMHQGNREIEKRNWNSTVYDPKNIDFFIITHAHIDHIGLLPRMLKMGFSNPIYASPPTRDLMEILLEDSAHIQEMEARWESIKRQRHGLKPVDPLYEQEDARKVVSLLQTRDYNEPFEPAPGVRVNFKDAGHILGSSFIEMWLDNGGEQVKLVFSGDIGRPNQLLVSDPSIIDTADFLVVESTYGNRDHKNEDLSRQELAEAIQYSYSRRGKVIIPAFAVERTQEVLFSLYYLMKEGKLPKDMPVFVDSPLAIKATQVFKNNQAYFDSEARGMLKNGEDPFSMPNLRYILSAEESTSLNSMDGPAIIISASGMANAGRIKHHLSHNLWKESTSVVFVGFQAMGTPGRKIVDGVEKIRLFGEDVSVKAKVFTINGFSAHAGQSQILEWLKEFRSKNMEVFLVHGEYEAQKVLAKIIRERFGWKVHIPDLLDVCVLQPGHALEQPRDIEKIHPRIDWDYLAREVSIKVEQLNERMNTLKTRPWVEQTDMKERLLDLNRLLSALISDVHPGESSAESSKDR